MQDHLSALPKDSRLRDYRIDSVLGVGGFGITYLATDMQLNMAVAIKEYLPNALAVRTENSVVRPKSQADQKEFRWGLDRFLLEARTLARFKHPNIVRVLRYFEANGTAYIIMDYEAGESLADYLKRISAPPKEAFLLKAFAPLLDGLKQVHQAGFLHRDIKPGNILLRRDMTPVLLDFGSARFALGTHTQSLTSVVTPRYAPLEQYFAEGKQGPWSDIYALGAVLYRCIAGSPPPDAVQRAKRDTLIPAADIGADDYSRPFLAAIDHALKINEEDRPQNVDGWLRSLTHPGAADEVAAKPSSAPIAAAQATTKPASGRPRTLKPLPAAENENQGSRSLRWLVLLVALFAAAVWLSGKLRKPAEPAAPVPAVIDIPAPTAPQAAAPTPPPQAEEPRPVAPPEIRPPPTAEPATAPPAESPRFDPRGESSGSPPPRPGEGGDPEEERRRLERRFARADANGDGYLSRAEAAAEFPMMAQNFDRLDTDRDGRLSPQEVQQGLEMRRRREFEGRDGRMPPPPPPPR